MIVSMIDARVSIAWLRERGRPMAQLPQVCLLALRGITRPAISFLVVYSSLAASSRGGGPLFARPGLARRPAPASSPRGVKTGVLRYALGQHRDRRPSHEEGFHHHLVKPVEVDSALGLLDGNR